MQEKEQNIENQKQANDPIKGKTNAKKVTIKIVVAIVAIVLAVLMSVLVWFGITLNATVNNISVDGEVIEVNSNTSIDSIAESLAQKKLIVSKEVFIIYAKFGPARGRLLPGPYLIKPSSSIREIINNMHSGKIAVSKITFPEGITINDMAKRWQAAGYGKKEDYIAVTKKLAPEYSFVPSSSKQNPEGYLFPSTYKFKVGSSAEVLVRMQYEQFEAQALPLLQQKSVGNLDQNQILTLASIVEKEALTQEDRKLVAGVFLNRIAQNMSLQSDVTVNYATGKTITEPKDIAFVSPYNTYQIKGLPPTPINNPSTNAIEAVLQATPSQYLYFLAGNDGKVYYAENYEKHVENIKKHL